MTFPSPTVQLSDCQENWDFLQTRIYSGNGVPNGLVQAAVGSIFLRRDGSVGTTFWVKESGGSSNTGWVAK